MPDMRAARGLFLHMGPGLHSQVEKEVFSTQLPHLYFWDQPLISQTSQALQDWVQATCDQINQLFERGDQQPITVVAHSVGGLLASMALESVHEKVNSCYFFSTAFDFPKTFIHLMNHLAKDSHTPSQTQKDMESFLCLHSSLDSDNFLQALQLIASTPNYLSHYWSDEACFLDYVQRAQKYPEIHMDTLVQLSLALLQSHSERLKESPFKAQVSIYLGSEDPLLDIETEKKLWLKVFPQAQIEELPHCGHFSHFETDKMSGLAEFK
jgi:alpha-beta hydrolase superfamily lysophospholipase